MTKQKRLKPHGLTRKRTDKRIARMRELLKEIEEYAYNGLNGSVVEAVSCLTQIRRLASWELHGK